MTIRRLVSLAARLLGLVVLVTSGIYLLVYLYRWEWNRALISGLFFVAAEMALATGALMQRLDRVERRIDDIDGGAGARRPAGDPETVEREHPFAWLEPNGLGVFVPVLLGIGVILSAIAYVVERVAALSGTWTSGRAVERRFAYVGGASGTLGLSAVTAPATMDMAARRSDRMKNAVTVVTALVLLVASVLALAGLTGYRADPPGVPGSSTTYVLTVEFRDIGGDPVAAAETLTSSCRALLDEEARIGITQDRETVVMRVSPSPGLNNERRFLGCLNDVTLDRVRVEAERIEPEEAGEAAAHTSWTAG